MPLKILGQRIEEEILNPKLKFETFIENSSPEYFMFGVFDADRLIGITGFTRMNRKRDRHRGELVQVYLDSDYRGQNIGEKLIKNVVEHAFTLDGLEQIQLSAVARNKGAIKLYEKVGFQTYGLQAHYFKVKDEYMDQVFMQLFKRDYHS